MPLAAPTPCTHPGCRAFANARTGGRCAAHARAAYRRYNREQRNRDHAAMYDHRWRRARLHFLATNPRCIGVGHPCNSPATEVDHIMPHHGDAELFWLESNWQPLCAGCHSRKTMQENAKAASNQAILSLPYPSARARPGQKV